MNPLTGAKAVLAAGGAAQRSPRLDIEPDGDLVVADARLRRAARSSTSTARRGRVDRGARWGVSACRPHRRRGRRRRGPDRRRQRRSGTGPRRPRTRLSPAGRVDPGRNAGRAGEPGGGITVTAPRRPHGHAPARRDRCHLRHSSGSTSPTPRFSGAAPERDALPRRPSRPRVHPSASARRISYGSTSPRASRSASSGVRHLSRACRRRVARRSRHRTGTRCRRVDRGHGPASPRPRPAGASSCASAAARRQGAQAGATGS